MTACGSASEQSPPAGVDGLVVPTPSVDPADFVERVDNRWLPLPPDAQLTYRVTGVDEATLTVSVRRETVMVAGVRATVVDTASTAAERTTDYYAQDRSGNVWWLGRDGAWRAGESGAEAGLAMPATPRLGDGWRAAYLEGVVEDTSSVVSVEDVASVPAGRFEGLVSIEGRSDLAVGVTVTRSYADGVGLVQSEATDGPEHLVELVSGP